MLDHHPHFSTPAGPYPLSDNGLPNKRKRRPAGTPDPDAEVVSLSPKTLLESDQYVCEICNQGFQRDQNLQMHRRRHKVTWKLLKRDSTEIKKRVFVCPEPSCLHHDPSHALGDLVGIKKHYRRKHSNNKQWVCDKCSKGYAVQSDYKAHLKTCGTRGHSCDCGRVFSRVESFIEHQDACTFRRVHGDTPAFQPVCSSHMVSITSPTSDMNFSSIPTMSRLPHLQPPPQALFSQTHVDIQNNLELQLLPSLSLSEQSNNHQNQDQLNLSIGRSDHSLQIEEMKMAMVDKAFAEDARQQAKKQIEIAEMEFENAKRIRQRAQVELERAKVLREQASKKIDFTILEITCYSCRQRFEGSSHNATAATTDYASIAPSYMSSALGEGEVDY
ncbi:putative transcription factor C2H2 family [Helianthus annuus]|uniref:Putative zinc finger C2H2-type/integrase DNA-binding domain-containing protein n=1 Tax=Helianthus annuus TaxID=4232 RepID=A0A251U680_HELAN|nr:zinc finger protein SHOOT GRAVITROPISM 5 [Helianthus annuus]KAF5795366.1 putative transcription factor C2H2 family [Helianthus annuus]KAJ0538876.1 putative transcription factor C2H2 family [Helianthus annuus]KAJ0722419.1 putative transcription factor C2H2 family [Helianthus annuus]